MSKTINIANNRFNKEQKRGEFLVNWKFVKRFCAVNRSVILNAQLIAGQLRGIQIDVIHQLKPSGSRLLLLG